MSFGHHTTKPVFMKVLPLYYLQLVKYWHPRTSLVPWSDPETFVCVWAFDPQVVERSVDRGERESCSSDILSAVAENEGQWFCAEMDVVYIVTSQVHTEARMWSLSAGCVTYEHQQNLPACMYNVKSHPHHHLHWKLPISFPSLHSHRLADGWWLCLFARDHLCVILFCFMLLFSTSWILTSLAVGTTELISNHVVQERGCHFCSPAHEKC